MDSCASETTLVFAAGAVSGLQNTTAMSNLFQNFDVVNIDVSDVHYLDLSELDLLIHAKKVSILKGKKLYIVGKNLVVNEIIEAFQLSDYFGYSLSTKFDSSAPPKQTYKS